MPQREVRQWKKELCHRVSRHRKNDFATLLLGSRKKKQLCHSVMSKQTNFSCHCEMRQWKTLMRQSNEALEKQLCHDVMRGNGKTNMPQCNEASQKTIMQQCNEAARKKQQLCHSVMS